jgi:sigma-B regulation protein RsbU (phosphoserine phosphatase)
LLLKEAGERSTLLDGDGLVLGVRPSAFFEDCEVTLEKGDRLLFYTDGLTEAQNRSGEFYGLERLRQAFEANRALAPEPLVRAILADMRFFCGPTPAGDDIAIVALQAS